MANTSFIPSSDLNFDAYKTSLKTFLRQQERFSDYDFEGSNLSVLIDLLTVNTVNNAFYLNMIGSEAFLDSATLRSSIVSRAKELNYTPRSRVSALTTVDIEITPNDTPGSITIPRNYAFRTTNTTGQTINFLTVESHVLQRDGNGRYIKRGVELREGVLVTETFDVQATTESGYTSYDSRFIMQSENIDASSIEVIVSTSDTDILPITYTRAYNVYGLTGNSRIFFLRGYGANQYEIEFGDGTFGYGLKTGFRVSITYRDTVGIEGNGRLAFTKTSSIQGYSNVTVNVTEYANAGAERESNQSIQFNAPRHYQTQERGVIDSDFRSLLAQNFPEVQASYVYGGEKIKRYGNVVVAVKPTDSYGRTSTSLKKRIKNFLETKTLTTQVIVEDPTYFVLKIVADIVYDLNLVDTNTESVRTSAIQALKAYEAAQLAKFGVKVFVSKLENVIETSDKSIIGCQAELSLVYQWIPATLSTPETIAFKLNNPLQTTVINQVAVETSPFFVLEDGNPIEVTLKDDGQGLLQLYRVETGALFKNNVGTVNYATGEIAAVVTATGYNGSTIDWTFRPAERALTIELNQFALIDTAYVDLTMVEG